MVKKIEELDFYELLNLTVDATDDDIRSAYNLAIATYQPDSLASYGVLSPEERRLVLDRIEKAFATLGNTDSRKAYNSMILATRPELGERAFFRKSTEKLEIGDGEKEVGLWKRARSLLFPSRAKKKKLERTNEHDRRHWEALRKSHKLHGEYLKWVREERGLTLEDVAQISGLDPGTLRLLEEDETSLLPGGKETYDLARQYARFLGIAAEEDE